MSAAPGSRLRYGTLEEGPHASVDLGIGGRIIVGRDDVDDPALQDAFGASPIITLDLGYGW